MVNWSGRGVSFRYPASARWERYRERVLTLLRGLPEPGEIDVPDLTTGIVMRPVGWEAIAAKFLVHRTAARDIQALVFEYLRPTVDDLPTEQTQKWLYDNAPIDASLRALCAMLTPDAMLKKNAIYALTLLASL